jgi:predicted HTH domain antitoxin
MIKTIKIEYPEYLADSLRLTGKDFETEIKVSSLVKLFEMGKISSSVASKVLGIDRIEFLELLNRYKVSVLNGYDIEELDEDIANA